MAVRARLLVGLDCLVVLAVLLLLAIELTGGFFMRIGELRISGRSPDRALLLAIATLGVRLLIDRRSGFLGVPGTRWRQLERRLFQPSSELPSPSAAPGAGRAGELVLAAAIFCAAGGLFLHEQLRSLYSVPDLGDPLFSIWRMGWVYRQLRGDPGALFDANIFHPERLTLTYSDAILLPGLTAAPLLLSGLHPVVVYNLVFLSGFLLSGLATYLLVHRLTGCTRAATISALVYGFYPYRFEHYSHLELQMTQWMPLGLLALHRFAGTGRLRDLLLLTLCAVAQLYSSMYYGIFFPLYAMAIGAVLWWFRPLPWRRLLVPAAAAGVVGILLALPLAYPYAAAQARKGSRDVAAVRVYSATATDYFRAHERSARYGSGLSGGTPERELFPGVMPLALAGAALVPPIGPLRLAYLVGLVAAFDGSLGMNGLVYPYLYDWLLPIRGLRVPARFSALVGLSLAVLAGFGTRRLLRRREGWKGHAVFAGLVALVCADLQPALRLQPVWRQPPPLYAAAGAPAGVVLAEFPAPAEPDALADNLPYMYFSVWHGAPMVNGYSGFTPPDYARFAETLASFPDAASLSALAARGVTHVTLNCALYGPRCEHALAAFGASPALRLITETEWQGRPARLYELRR